LFAAPVFAEINVGMWNAAFARVIGFDTIEDSDPNVAWGGETRIDFSASNAEGTFGAFTRLGYHSQDLYGHFGWGWWQPIPQVRLQVGWNPFGNFLQDQIVGWAFYGDAGDLTAADGALRYRGGHNRPSTDRLGAFYGGFNYAGATLSLLPVDGLAINVGIPFGLNGRTLGDFGASDAEDVYKQMMAQATYAIPDIGTVAITFAGNRHDFDDRNPSTIFASFNLTGIQDIGLNVGFAFPLPIDNEPGTVTFQPAIRAGFGVSYLAGEFGVRARMQTRFAGATKPNVGDDIKEPFVLEFDVLPFYDLGPVTAFFSAGLHLTVPDGDNVDNIVGWHVNPYITARTGPGRFFAGVRIFSNGALGRDPKNLDNAIVEIAVPVGIIFSL